MQACELQPPPRTLTAAGRSDQLLHLRRGGGPEPEAHSQQPLPGKGAGAGRLRGKLLTAGPATRGSQLPLTAGIWGPGRLF